MLEYLTNNKEWLFSGIGVFALSLLLIKGASKIKMGQKSGKNSINLQSKGDIKVSINDVKNGDK